VTLYLLVTDDDLELLAMIPDLQKLYLKGMPITDDSIDTLSQLKQLQYVDVGETQITASGLRELQVALPNCVIKTDE